MIEPILAKSFVKKIGEYTEYNVNIFDKKGYIIASRDSSRIGSFHEAAYNMIRYRKEKVEVQDNISYLGAKPGVNLIVMHEGEPVGVVGVTGKPDQVREIALIIKMALETMIRHEIQMRYLSQQKNTRDLFYVALFKEEIPERENLEDFARQLGYSKSRLRVPILLFFDEDRDMMYLKNEIENRYCGNQDMCWPSDGRKHIIVFKSLSEEKEAVLAKQKAYIEEWLVKLNEGVKFRKAYVGATQCRLHYYRFGLDTCRWLEKNIFSEDAVIYIYDYLREYIRGLLPIAELNILFNSYSAVLDEETERSIAEIIGTLQKNNYNMVKSSEDLFIHKNTMAFRVNKIRNLLNADPFHSSQDRVFLEMLALFLSEKPKV